ncbi:Mor transcription activator family protein [Paracidovorax wautersii]|uniref:Mor transcription activator family protein n=1 Tax=Paracidovorax wautersii TaxID=1177982 RepID=UPI0031DDAF65
MNNDQTHQATRMRNARPHPQLDALIEQEPDLVDRIFDYLVRELPELSGGRAQEVKKALRAEFRGEEVYIPARDATARQRMVAQVLTLFNGRNAREVARELRISRATVYRYIKQAGGIDSNPSHVSGK